MTSANPPAYTVSLLTDTEKWLFDLHGATCCTDAGSPPHHLSSEAAWPSSVLPRPHSCPPPCCRPAGRLWSTPHCHAVLLSRLPFSLIPVRCRAPGYLVLRQAVLPSDVAELLSELNSWCEAEADPPQPLNRGEQLGPSGRSKMHIGSPHYDSQAYQRLNLNQEILRIVSGMMMGSPRLMHSVATKMWLSPASDPLPGFHRDTDGFVFPLGFRNPHNDYQASAGNCTTIPGFPITTTDLSMSTTWSLEPYP